MNNDALVNESGFTARLRFAGYEALFLGSNSFAQGWGFALSVLDDAFTHGDYLGAMAVPDTVDSFNSEFNYGYRELMLFVKHNVKK